MEDNKPIIKNHRHLTTFDLKAEIFFNALLEDGINDSQIVIKYKSLFYRNFRKDKMDLFFDSRDDDLINLEISRDGFYDILPESIIHNNRNRNIANSAVEEFKERKKEEKEARNFFSPLENEFFRFRHAIENFEAHFFSKLNSSKVADIIRIILAVDDRIPDKLLIKLFYAVLKQNQSNDQSIGTIGAILENILEEEVTFTTSYIKLKSGYDENESGNDMVLGVNTTLESNEVIYLKKINFLIGPLKNSKNLEYYFKDEVMELFISTFFNLFLPFQLQFAFKIKLNAEDEKFTMDQQSYKSRLGISTLL